jgi:poly(3-hydroxybutyrate) depolymerase
MIRLLAALLVLALLSSCAGGGEDDAVPRAGRETRTITHIGTSVDIVIDRPAAKEADVLVVYHGTVSADRGLAEAANRSADEFKALVAPREMLVVSVAYPQENVLFGDGIAQAEAALLWVKERAGRELGITVRRVFLAGHSQGGHVVTRLNTMHRTDGVIANAPGPLDLVFRCELEETGRLQTGSVCTKLREAYGTTGADPEAYLQRSLVRFTDGFKADILFVQGLADSPVQLRTWPAFAQAVKGCSRCEDVQVLELPGLGHESIFNSTTAKAEVQSFLDRR